MGRGIDYGHGLANIDFETGIRYGVISANECNSDAVYDSFIPDYGPPTCPECGAEEIVPLTELTDDPEVPEDAKGDYYCQGCKLGFDSCEAFSEEPMSNTLDDGEYKASLDEYNDIFILKSPYYTRAAYCSPCAPGACHLASPCEDGDKAYCLGGEWFEGGKAPYPVYRVKDDSIVEAEGK
jgi:hypothetical protein